MERFGIPDAQWALIADLFPPPRATGRPPMAARQVFEGVCWILRTGAPWRDLPDAFGPWETVYGRYNKWVSDGTLDRLIARVRTQFGVEEWFDHSLWLIDSTIVRAHRCAAGGGKKGIRANRPTTHWDVPAGATRPRSAS